MTKKVRLAIKRLETELQLQDSMTASVAFLVFIEDIRTLIEHIKTNQRRKHV